MNNFMSRAFGILLNGFHLLVAWVLTQSFLRDENTGSTIIFVFIYIFLAGIAYTLISIRESLDRLVKGE